jgi:predicted Zn-dependent peptidase
VRRFAGFLAVAVGATQLGAQVKLLPYTRQVLDNGAVVTLMPKKDVPLITVRVLAKGGLESDPTGQ